MIGINTSILSDAQNIGFAVPINLVKDLLPSLQKHGHVVRPWLGFHGQLIGAELRKLIRLSLVDGLLVEVVEAGSPAEKAGIHGGNLELSVGGDSVLLGGDVVVSINGTPVTDADKVAKVVRELHVASKVKIRLFRDDRYHEVEYELPERPLLPSDLPGAHTLAPDMGARPLPMRAAPSHRSRKQP